MMSHAWQKCGNLHYAITYIIWTNQKTEHHWLCALAMFDVTTFPPFCQISDVILSSIGNFNSRIAAFTPPTHRPDVSASRTRYLLWRRSHLVLESDTYRVPSGPMSRSFSKRGARPLMGALEGQSRVLSPETMTRLVGSSWSAGLQISQPSKPTLSKTDRC